MIAAARAHRKIAIGRASHASPAAPGPALHRVAKATRPAHTEEPDGTGDLVRA